tara:strand:+ start:135415 stop:136857 length:1443 start_codon:yes stop_codon:yes gene_type:complete
MKIRTLAVCAVLTASSLAFAQAHTDSFVYQGELMDMGAPADGLYDISFIVYDSQVGGSIVVGGAQTVPNVQVTNGRFETLVNFGVTGSVFDSDQVRWLNIAIRPAGVGGYTQITPRQRISPAPLANYALRSGTDLQAAFDNGNEIFFAPGSGILELHSNTDQDAAIRINNANGDPRALFFENGFGAGDIALYGNGNTITSRMYNDNSAGGGGFAYITRNDIGDFGIVLEGNSAGTESAIVSIFGETESIFLNTRSSGNSSVAIPNNAIEALEIYNEAGVAETANALSVVLTPASGVTDVLDSVTINAPTAGYVFVIATAEVTIGHSNPSTATANFGVSALSTSMPTNGDVELRMDGNGASGSYDYPVTVQAIFPAVQGANTYYFLGDQNSTAGSFTVLDKQLSAIFIPTAYGTVSRETGINTPDDQTPTTAPRTNYDILQEQNAALQADSQRQQRELEEIRAMMQHMKQQLDRNSAQKID